MSYTLTFAFGATSGQTIHAQLLDTSFATSGAAITSGVTEIGNNGNYGYTATINDTFDGYIKFYVSGDTDDVVSLFAISRSEHAGVYNPVSALNVDTYAEPSSVPAATSTLVDKTSWLFAMARNKRITTETTDTLRDDSDSTDIASATVSDDGSTFTREGYS